MQAAHQAGQEADDEGDEHVPVQASKVVEGGHAGGEDELQVEDGGKASHAIGHPDSSLCVDGGAEHHDDDEEAWHDVALAIGGGLAGHHDRHGNLVVSDIELGVHVLIVGQGHGLHVPAQHGLGGQDGVLDLHWVIGGDQLHVLGGPQVGLEQNVQALLVVGKVLQGEDLEDGPREACSGSGPGARGVAHWQPKAIGGAITSVGSGVGQGSARELGGHVGDLQERAPGRWRSIAIAPGGKARVNGVAQLRAVGWGIGLHLQQDTHSGLCAAKALGAIRAKPVVAPSHIHKSVQAKVAVLLLDVPQEHDGEGNVHVNGFSWVGQEARALVDAERHVLRRERAGGQQGQGSAQQQQQAGRGGGSHGHCRNGLMG